MRRKTKKRIAHAQRAPRAKNKLAIVMSGGGMRCVYGVGILTALAEEYGYPIPDIVVAASGSVGGVTYYLSKQYRETLVAWLSTLSGKRFVSFGRRKILDIDYLIDDVFKKMHPLNFANLKSAHTLILYAATRVKDGATVFLNPPKAKALYEYMRAAKAVPVAYGRQVCIRNTAYIDGDFGADTEDLVREAVTRGATHIIVVENEPEGKTLKKRIVLRGMKVMAHLHHAEGLVRAENREMLPHHFAVPKKVSAVRLAPSRILGLTVTERRKSRLREAFNLGYADAANNQELATLLKRYARAHRK